MSGDSVSLPTLFRVFEDSNEARDLIVREPFASLAGAHTRIDVAAERCRSTERATERVTSRVHHHAAVSLLADRLRFSSFALPYNVH